ncbi:NupC/NupG family nucleoside CNT transporter [Actomonas aquatica]|uniref:Nucleoside transporter C-terminal domain-containing protein n=1 Tax=Actomonas aquatica TaxID=2866162 RepID=A0ABZ1CCT7_9BACT|nr:nucleoside transporter C-terminal domain-containing protein [Opitutus sp. WL0086]WRQ89359.1 nucleoside transporter C-terminal domain-containing protein [Opitutus sp. WL0086]
MDTVVPILRGLIGIVAFTGIAYAFSTNRRAIDWKLVGTGMLLQIVVALIVIKVGFVRAIFDAVGRGFVKVIDFTNEGTGLVFGWLNNIAPGNVEGLPFTNGGPVFVITILPTIIFFAAITSMLYYLGVLQRIVYVFAWLMSKTMRLGGAESMSASANIFVGQTEAPLLIKPYLDRMTRSELLAIMIGGMATIAGGVMAVYIALLGGDDPAARVAFATHLLTKSVISAPCALVIAKILLPQEEKIDTNIEIPRDKFGSNVLDAICSGTTDGVKLAVNVGAMLIVFTALVAMINFGLGDLLGEWLGLNSLVASLTGGEFTKFSMEFILGIIGAPLAWLMGIDSGHLLMAGNLLGQKTVLNEFVAYFSMNTLAANGELTDERTRIILTYALAGFSNLVSIGIQIGGIGALAPERRADLAQLGWRALLGGSLACFIPASIAGMLI